MTARRGSVRSAVRIARPADELWSLLGDPARVHEWFTGIVSCTVDGDERVITLGSGITMPERIVTVDPLLHRFQYRITAPVFSEHLSTLDIHDLGDGTCLVVYAVDAEPAVMALVIGGAAGAALKQLRRRLEPAAP